MILHGFSLHYGIAIFDTLSSISVTLKIRTYTKMEFTIVQINIICCSASGYSTLCSNDILVQKFLYFFKNNASPSQKLATFKGGGGHWVNITSTNIYGYLKDTLQLLVTSLVLLPKYVLDCYIILSKTIFQI